jgi:hypothetical protein
LKPKLTSCHLSLPIAQRYSNCCQALHPHGPDCSISNNFQLTLLLPLALDQLHNPDSLVVAFAS